jgi:hypothetical protein
MRESGAEIEQTARFMADDVEDVANALGEGAEHLFAFAQFRFRALQRRDVGEGGHGATRIAVGVA